MARASPDSPPPIMATSYFGDPSGEICFSSFTDISSSVLMLAFFINYDSKDGTVVEFRRGTVVSASIRVA
jgi:hypothetical protein